MNTVLAKTQAWLKQPFTSSMNLGGWVLITVVLITVALLWMQVVKTFEVAA